MALCSAPIVGLGIFAFELTTGGHRMNSPMNVVKLASFDEGNQHPNDIIKSIRSDLDLMNQIVREHIIENQKKLKLTFDEKVTPYLYSVGGIVFLNDSVKRVGVSGKLRRVWCGTYQITWLSSHNCGLLHTLTGKVINGLVHINRIKPYFYRDLLPDDLEDVLDGDEARLERAPVPEEVVQGASAVPKIVKSGKVKNRKAGREPVTEKVAITKPTHGEQEGLDKPADIDEDTEVPDPDTMYEAQCILKQKQRKGGRRQFLEKWVDQSSANSWCDENDVSEALLAHWFIVHNQKGLKRKRLNLALLNMPGSWACRRWWDEETSSRVERVD